ncbi:MAG: sensor histidine kinase [Candidatus Limnocylindrales bacterium]
MTPDGAPASDGARGTGGVPDGIVAAGAMAGASDQRDFLRRIPLLEGLSDEDIEWVASFAVPQDLPIGGLLTTEGEPGDALYLVISGDLEVLKRSGSGDVPIARLGPGEIVGEMAVLESRPRTASVRAISPVRVLCIPGPTLLELLRTRPGASISMIRTVMARLRNTQAMLREREKLAALGTLSAGLAHELNNPAAAVQRSSGLLREALDRLADASRSLGGVIETRVQAEFIASLGSDLAGQPTGAAEDPLELSDRSADLELFLGDHGVADAGDVASALASQGWTVSRLEQVEAAFPGLAFAAVASWLGASGLAHALVEEVSTGARRISEIVRAVKEYVYLDQAPVQRVDVRAGIQSTLVILRPKLKDGIRVVQEYARDLPPIEAYGSELNQVWTNILDNAIDALGGRGEIRIHAYLRDEEVVVELCDNGPGMPPELRERIFEPFFTTKPPGLGTGLGLHISHNVILRHGGRVNVRSRPGETCFEVVLPRERPSR